MVSSLVKGSVGCKISSYLTMIYSGSISEPLVKDLSGHTLSNVMDTYGGLGYNFKVVNLRPIDLSFMLTYVNHVVINDDNLTSTRLLCEVLYDMMASYAYSEDDHPTIETIRSSIEVIMVEVGFTMNRELSDAYLQVIYDAFFEVFSAIDDSIFFNSTFVGWEENYVFILGEN
jgi:hypothetical protein